MSERQEATYVDKRTGEEVTFKVGEVFEIGLFPLNGPKQTSRWEISELPEGISLPVLLNPDYLVISTLLEGSLVGSNGEILPYKAGDKVNFYAASLLTFRNVQERV